MWERSVKINKSIFAIETTPLLTVVCWSFLITKRLHFDRWVSLFLLSYIWGFSKSIFITRAWFLGFWIIHSKPTTYFISNAYLTPATYFTPITYLTPSTSITPLAHFTHVTIITPNNLLYPINPFYQNKPFYPNNPNHPNNPL